MGAGPTAADTSNEITPAINLMRLVDIFSNIWFMESEVTWSTYT